MMKVKKMSQEPAIEFFGVDDTNPQYLPFVGDISHGFPLPSDDYMDRCISLDEQLVRNPEATIFGRVKGDSMKDANLAEGDILVIDRSIKVENGQIGIFRIDGEFLCKRLFIFPDRVELRAENKRFKAIVYDNDNVPADFIAVGRVMHIIKAVV